MSDRDNFLPIVEQIVKRYGRVIDLEESPFVMLEILRTFGHALDEGEGERRVDAQHRLHLHRPIEADLPVAGNTERVGLQAHVRKPQDPAFERRGQLHRLQHRIRRGELGLILWGQALL